MCMYAGSPKDNNFPFTPKVGPPWLWLMPSSLFPPLSPGLTNPGQWYGVWGGRGCVSECIFVSMFWKSLLLRNLVEPTS